MGMSTSISNYTPANYRPHSAKLTAPSVDTH